MSVPVTTCLGLVVHGKEFSAARFKRIVSTGPSRHIERDPRSPKRCAMEFEPFGAEIRVNPRLEDSMNSNSLNVYFPDRALLPISLEEDGLCIEAQARCQRQRFSEKNGLKVMT